MTPFRLGIVAQCVLPLEVLRQNAAANRDIPRIERCAPHGRKLAVVGGGPLVANDLDELRAWDGDVWGINYTAQWLNENGVPATLFTVDPQYFEVKARDAILGSVCHPGLFAQFEGRVRAFDMIEVDPKGYAGGAFSATRAPIISMNLGYMDVSFFGCEGCMAPDGTDHVDRQEGWPHQLIVRAGGQDYITYPPYLIQCEELSKLFYFDGVYHNRSGGLLKAIVENPDTWSVVAVSASLKQHLEEVNGKCGLYEEPYTVAA